MTLDFSASEFVNNLSMISDRSVFMQTTVKQEEDVAAKTPHSQ